MPTSPQSLAELLAAFTKRKPGQAPGTGEPVPPTGGQLGGMGPDTQAGQDPAMADPQAAISPASASIDMPPHFSLRAMANTPEGQAMMSRAISASSSNTTKPKQGTPHKPAPKKPAAY